MAETITMAEHYRKTAELFRVMADKTDVRKGSAFLMRPIKVLSKDNLLYLAELAEEKACEYDG